MTRLAFLAVVVGLLSGINSFTLTQYNSSEIEDLCPYSSFCKNTSTTEEPVWTDFQPCCASCSCHEYCGLTNTCCYEDHDQYHLKERYNMKCITPLVANGPVTDHNAQKIQSYFMVDECKMNNSSVETIACRKRNGDDFLLPVFSNDTGMIFFNEDCARCNGLSPSMYRYMQILISTWSKTKQTSSSLTWKLQQMVNNDSYFTFYKPQDDVSLKNWKCYTKDTKCETVDSGIAALCQDLNMPFIYELHTGMTRSYKNVYCAMCDNIPRTDIRDKCPIQADASRSERYPIIKLLETSNINHISDLEKRFSLQTSRPWDGISCPPGEVFNSFTNSCLIIICQDGTLNFGAECKTLGLTFSNGIGMLQLRLKIPTPASFTTSMLAKLNQADKNKPSRWMSSTCLKNERKSFLSVYVNPPMSNISRLVQSIVLRVHFVFTDWETTDIVDVMKTIHEMCVKSNRWKMRVAGQAFVFKSEFYKYSSYIQDGVNKDRHSVIPHEFQNVLPKLFDQVAADRRSMILPTHLISKSRFCKQVELEEEEVDQGLSAIRILPTMYELGNNMFYADRIGTAIRYRICIDDFYKARGISTVSNGSQEIVYHRSRTLIVLQSLMWLVTSCLLVMCFK